MFIKMFTKIKNYFIRRRNAKRVMEALNSVIVWDDVSKQQVFVEDGKRHIVVEYYSGGGLWIVIEESTCKLLGVSPIK